jgi:exonuclease VII large subunit
MSKEKLKNKNREYYKRNKEKLLAWHKDFYERNKEKLGNKNREYYKRNKEKIMARHMRYTEQNKKRCRLCGRILRTKISKVNGFCVVCPPPEVWGIVGNAQEPKILICK